MWAGQLGMETADSSDDNQCEPAGISRAAGLNDGRQGLKNGLVRFEAVVAVLR